MSEVKEIKIHAPNMPPELVKPLEDFLNGQKNAGETIVMENAGAFSIWLQNKNPQLFRKVKPYLDAVFEALEKALDITHGILWHIGRALCN